MKTEHAGERWPRTETDISTFEVRAPNSQGRRKCLRGEELRTRNSSGSALLEVPSALPGDHHHTAGEKKGKFHRLFHRVAAEQQWLGGFTSLIREH